MYSSAVTRFRGLEIVSSTLIVYSFYPLHRASQDGRTYGLMRHPNDAYVKVLRLPYFIKTGGIYRIMYSIFATQTPVIYYMRSAKLEHNINGKIRLSCV